MHNDILMNFQRIEIWVVRMQIYLSLSYMLYGFISPFDSNCNGIARNNTLNLYG